MCVPLPWESTNSTLWADVFLRLPFWLQVWWQYNQMNEKRSFCLTCPGKTHCLIQLVIEFPLPVSQSWWRHFTSNTKWLQWTNTFSMSNMTHLLVDFPQPLLAKRVDENFAYFYVLRADLGKNETFLAVKDCISQSRLPLTVQKQIAVMILVAQNSITSEKMRWFRTLPFEKRSLNIISTHPQTMSRLSISLQLKLVVLLFCSCCVSLIVKAKKKPWIPELFQRLFVHCLKSTLCFLMFITKNKVPVAFILNKSENSQPTLQIPRLAHDILFLHAWMHTSVVHIAFVDYTYYTFWKSCSNIISVQGSFPGFVHWKGIHCPLWNIFWISGDSRPWFVHHVALDSINTYAPKTSNYSSDLQTKAFGFEEIFWHVVELTFRYLMGGQLEKIWSIPLSALEMLFYHCVETVWCKCALLKALIEWL